MQKTEAARLGENRCLTPLSDNRRLNKQKLDLQHLKLFCYARRQKNAFSKLVQKNAKFLLAIEVFENHSNVLSDS
jgi:hypothetical protein